MPSLVSLSPSLPLLSLSLPLFLSVSLSLPRYGVISCKALLSRCGNFIFATNLQPPPPSSHPSRPLVGSSSVLSLSTFARARARACPCPPLVSSPSRKVRPERSSFIYVVLVLRPRPVHSRSASFHRGCSARCFIPN